MRKLIGLFIAVALVAPMAMAQVAPDPATPRPIRKFYSVQPYIKDKIAWPAYPPGSREAREEGKVEVWLDLSDAGEVERVGLILSSGHKRLDDATLAWARSLKFEPARFVDTEKQINKPGGVRDWRISYDWRLEGEGRMRMGNILR